MTISALRQAAHHAASRGLCYGRQLRTAGTAVPNSGSTARDHLANERTFLAWARTGLGFMGAGTGLFTAYHLADNYTPEDVNVAPVEVDIASGLLIGNGGVVLGFAVYKYFRTQSLLNQGSFVIAKTGLIGVCATTALSSAVALGLVYKAEHDLLEVKRLKQQGITNR